MKRDMSVEEKGVAMMAAKPLPVEVDEVDCFKPTEKAPPRVIAAGAINNGGKAEMLADANTNGGNEGVVMLPEFNAVYVSEQEATLEWFVKFDDGRGTSGHFSTTADQTDERTERIISQVRYAGSQEDLDKALSAAYSYDAVLYYSLKQVYGLKFAVGAKWFAVGAK